MTLIIHYLGSREFQHTSTLRSGPCRDLNQVWILGKHFTSYEYPSHAINGRDYSLETAVTRGLWSTQVLEELHSSRGKSLWIGRKNEPFCVCTFARWAIQSLLIGIVELFWPKANGLIFHLSLHYFSGNYDQTNFQYTKFQVISEFYSKFVIISRTMNIVWYSVIQRGTEFTFKSKFCIPD